MVLLWVVCMHNKYYALFVGVPCQQLITTVSCAIVKARFSTVSSHPTEFKVAKHDFIIHDQIICLDILDVANKCNEIHLFFFPATRVTICAWSV